VVSPSSARYPPAGHFGQMTMVDRMSPKRLGAGHRA
jgi:hypothetical protein